MARNADDWAGRRHAGRRPLALAQRMSIKHQRLLGWLASASRQNTGSMQDPRR